MDTYFHLNETMFYDFIAALLTSTLYFTLILITRYNCLIATNRKFIKNYYELNLARFSSENSSNPDRNRKTEKEAQAILKDIETFLNKEQHIFIDIFSTTGEQLANWRKVHEAKTLTIDLMTDETLKSHGVALTEELKSIDHPARERLYSEIENQLKADPEKFSVDLLKSLLKEAQSLIFNDRDEYFESLADWQNRAMWMSISALVILVLLSGTIGNTHFFILGAIGGLLSRLRTAMGMKNAAFDYGVTWSRLFLAPLVGALTGWSGALISMVFIKYNILPINTETIHLPTTWENAEGNGFLMTMAIAFGFSATLFEHVMDRIGKGTNNKSATNNTGQ